MNRLSTVAKLRNVLAASVGFFIRRGHLAGIHEQANKALRRAVYGQSTSMGSAL